MTNKGVKSRAGVTNDMGVSQAALSCADHDNLTVVVCSSTRDSRLRITLAAPIGRIYCQGENIC